MYKHDCNLNKQSVFLPPQWPKNFGFLYRSSSTNKHIHINLVLLYPKDHSRVYLPKKSMVEVLESPKEELTVWKFTKRNSRLNSWEENQILLTRDRFSDGLGSRISLSHLYWNVVSPYEKCVYKVGPFISRLRSGLDKKINERKTIANLLERGSNKLSDPKHLKPRIFTFQWNECHSKNHHGVKDVGKRSSSHYL